MLSKTATTVRLGLLLVAILSGGHRKGNILEEGMEKVIVVAANGIWPITGQEMVTKGKGDCQ